MKQIRYIGIYPCSAICWAWRGKVRPLHAYGHITIYFFNAGREWLVYDHEGD